MHSTVRSSYPSQTTVQRKLTLQIIEYAITKLEEGVFRYNYWDPDYSMIGIFLTAYESVMLESDIPQALNPVIRLQEYEEARTYGIDNLGLPPGFIRRMENLDIQPLLAIVPYEQFEAIRYKMHRIELTNRSHALMYFKLWRDALR